MVVAVTLGTLALASRGVGVWSWTVPAAVGVVGITVAPTSGRSTSLRIWITVTIVASAAFVLAGSSGSVPASGTGLAIFASAAAAVGEELFFRRAIYGLLERRSVVFAIAASSALFALVHVPMYGWRFAALDLAAGFVFGWQRWATGTWTSPAVSHVVANVIQFA